MTSDDGIFADYMADDELSVIHQDEATLRALAAALDATCPYGLTHPKGSHLREAAAILEAEPRLTLAERHMKQSINGCVTCERPWSEHVVFTKIADPPVKPNPDFYRDTFESVEDAEMADPEHTPGCKDGECRTCEGPLMAEQERLAAIGAEVERKRLRVKAYGPAPRQALYGPGRAFANWLFNKQTDAKPEEPLRMDTHAECNAKMRKLTNNERGCDYPQEHYDRKPIDAKP